MMQMRKTDLI